MAETFCPSCKLFDSYLIGNQIHGHVFSHEAFMKESLPTYVVDDFGY